MPTIAGMIVHMVQAGASDKLISRALRTSLAYVRAVRSRHGIKRSKAVVARRKIVSQFR